MILHIISAAGFFAFAGIAWLFSSNRRKVQWKTVVWGMGLQLAIGLLIFQLPGSQRIFLWLNDAVLALLNVSKSGSAFLFGPLAAGPGEQGSIGFILIFQVLPVALNRYAARPTSSSAWNRLW
jgi:concentrative nucleoside transporter, CNT family